MGGENMPVQLIGDLLASELAHMQPYIRFCSCQLNAAALLQSKTHNQPDFKDFLKVRDDGYSRITLWTEDRWLVEMELHLFLCFSS